jgi:hypothetical protein
VLVEFRPALQSEAFFRTLFDLANQDKKSWFHELLQMAVLLREYKNEVYPALPPLFVQIVPLFVQRVFFWLLAIIGWVLGYKARYPKYGGSE